MRVLFVIFSLLLTNASLADVPDSVVVYQWDELPDSIAPEGVVAISFRKMRLESLPKELAKFQNLEYLILSKNKLVALPLYIAEMHKLKYLDLSQNKFTELPNEVCELKSLTTLILNRNEFSTLPDCISQANNLSYIDLWDNPIRTLPMSMVAMKNLRKVDLSGIKFSPSFQKGWVERMSWVRFVFEEPCDCMN